ncbi:MAG: hypothetical protein ACRD3S_22520 [Terracidiphilus sp.]
MKKSSAQAKPVPAAKLGARRDKYFLRDLHQEIDFYDRKLAYLDKFGEFASPADREEAEKGLRAKRAPLERAALELAASGIEYNEKDLPRSFRAMHPERDEMHGKLTLVNRS